MSVDVNQAVENPNLVKALAWVAKENTNESKDSLLMELNKATYLAAILTDEIMSTPGIYPNQAIAEAGSQIKYLSASSDGKLYLPLFSDWSALQKYTTEKVTGQILRAADAWRFVLQSDIFYGVVINPPHNALPLDRPMLNFLYNSMQEQ